jgi:hypothetical protein
MSLTEYYASVIAEHDAVYVGIQYGPKQNLVLFADRQNQSTLAVVEQEFSPEAVGRRLESSRMAFDRGRA